MKQEIEPIRVIFSLEICGWDAAKPESNSLE